MDILGKWNRKRRINEAGPLGVQKDQDEGIGD